ALAQEKTGEFWVDGQLFGRPRCHTAGDFEHAEVALFVGKNPWQSHGFPRARTVLKAIAKDPRRSLIVIDPRRTETAELADIHLRVRPGTDAYALAALAAVLVEEDLLDHAFLDAHASNLDTLLAALRAVPIADYCARAGLAEADVRTAARRIGGAASLSTFEDLGIQQAPHSTLSSYLEKLLFLLTGHFAEAGSMNIHTRFASLGGGGGGSRTSPVGGHRIITGLVPAAVIPDEILTDHPKRFRAMLIESGNPVHSLPDSQRMRAALDALDLVVVIDVALTETGRHAHYVLPAASQYEKWEATFFTLEFPDNVFHLRAPLFAALPGTLPEPEIHRRLVRALEALTDDDVAPLHAAAAQGRAAFAAAFLQLTAERPDLARLAPILLYETLGPTLPAGAASAAAVWGLAHTVAMAYPESVRRAGFTGDGLELGEALFEAVLTRGTGVVFSVDEYAETWRRLATPDGRINFTIPELLAELAGLTAEQPTVNSEFPFVLSAGERRSWTANTIFRDPAWRKKASGAALRMHPSDAQRVGVEDGGRVRVTTKRGSVEAAVELTDTLLPGHVSLPNGLGVAYPDDQGRDVVHGAAPNELTASEDRDWLAGTPWHKHVRARIEAVTAAH
ncbi:MAG: molybdopterin dinucleotide binding domain-containing protein, partial [bacterium]